MCLLPVPNNAMGYLKNNYFLKYTLAEKILKDTVRKFSQ